MWKENSSTSTRRSLQFLQKQTRPQFLVLFWFMVSKKALNCRSSDVGTLLPVADGHAKRICIAETHFWGHVRDAQLLCLCILWRHSSGIFACLLASRFVQKRFRVGRATCDWIIREINCIQIAIDWAYYIYRRLARQRRRKPPSEWLTALLESVWLHFSEAPILLIIPIRLHYGSLLYFNLYFRFFHFSSLAASLMPVQQKKTHPNSPTNTPKPIIIKQSVSIHSLFLRRKLTTCLQQQSRAVREQTWL